MTPTQAIKLLKNGEAQLENDVRNFDLIHRIMTEAFPKDQRGSQYQCTYYMNGSICLENPELWVSSNRKFLDLPIIKLSEIDETDLGELTKIHDCSFKVTFKNPKKEFFLTCNPDLLGFPDGDYRFLLEAEVEENCTCRVYGDALYQCDNCYEQAVKNHVCDYHCENGGFCLKRSDENMKRVLREIRYTKRTGHTIKERDEAKWQAESDALDAIKYALNMPDGKTYDIAPPKTCAAIHSVASVKNNLSGKKFYKGTVEDKPILNPIADIALQVLDAVISTMKQSLKPNTMQVTNNNGEITLNGIVIDNKTADRIVEIRKEQLSAIEPNKWYKNFTGAIINFQGYKDFACYGFDCNGKWTQHTTFYDHESWTPATAEEVTEALTKEAVKRGFVKGVTVDRSSLKREFVNPIVGLDTECEPRFENDRNQFAMFARVVFDNGQWATIVPTYTHAQIEEKIGKFNYKGE